MKTLTLLFLTLIVSFSQAQQADKEIKNVDGKKVFVYIVEKGDSWYSIARKFKLTYPEIRLANKDSSDKLFPGRKLYIPVDKLDPNDPYFDKKYVDEKKRKPEKEVLKYYTVKNSQTLFSISKMFTVPVDSLKKWNKLTKSDIHHGQKLIVSKSFEKSKVADEKKVEQPLSLPATSAKTTTTITTSTVKPEVFADSNLYHAPVKKESTEKVNDPEKMEVIMNDAPKNPDDKKSDVKVEKKEAVSDYPKDDDLIFSNGRKEVNETGVAAWIENEDEINTDKYYALHRTAPIGTVIRVMNMANSRKIFVKVIGVLADAQGDEGTLIKISKASAEKLGVTGKTFKVHLLYGVSKE